MKKAWKSLKKSIRPKDDETYPQHRAPSYPGASDLTGRAPQSLEPNHTPHNRNGSPYNTNGPPRGMSSQPHVQTSTRTNDAGRRVTETTVRVPAGYAGPTGNKPETPSQQPPSTTEQTRNLVKKFIADIWNRGEVDLIPEVCSPNLRLNGNTGFDRVGHDGLARMVSIIRDALSDYHCEIHSMVVEQNKAFCRLRFTGKHTGTLMGYPATGKVVAWMGATEFTCQNGKILKVWELGDVKSLEDQLKTASEESTGSEI